MTAASIMPSMARIRSSTSLSMGLSTGQKAASSPLVCLDKAEARDVYVVLPEDGRHLADDARPVHDTEMEEGAFGYDVEAELVVEHDTTRSVREDGAGDRRLPPCPSSPGQDEVVELLELLRLRLLDGDVPVLHEIGRVDESDRLLARDLEKALEGRYGEGLDS